MINPLRSEGEAFRFLIYVLIAAVLFVALIEIIRAIT